MSDNRAHQFLLDRIIQILDTPDQADEDLVLAMSVQTEPKDVEVRPNWLSVADRICHQPFRRQP